MGNRAAVSEKSTRPHETDGKTAHGTAHQRQQRMRRKNRGQITENAQASTEQQAVFQIQAAAIQPIEKASGSHQRRKQDGPSKSPSVLETPRPGLRKERRPLAHGQLAGACAQHDHQHQQEQPVFCTGLSRSSAFLPVPGGTSGNLCKKEHVQKGQNRPANRQPHPDIRAESRENQRADEHHTHLAPAVEGVEQASCRWPFYPPGRDSTMGLTSTSSRPPPSA